MKPIRPDDPPFFDGRRMFGPIALTALGGFAGGMLAGGLHSPEEARTGWEGFVSAVRGFAIGGAILGGFLASPSLIVLWAFAPSSWIPRTRWGWGVASFVLGGLIAGAASSGFIAWVLSLNSR